MYYYPNHNKKFYLHSEIKKYFYWIQFPEVIDDDFLTNLNIHNLKETYVDNDYTKTAIEQTPVKIDNIWYRQWEVRDATEEEKQERTFLKSIQVRDIRNKLLIESDWSQGKDITNSISDSWSEYRQLLRDIPQQENFPWDVVWPIKP